MYKNKNTYFVCRLCLKRSRQKETFERHKIKCYNQNNIK